MNDVEFKLKITSRMLDLAFTNMNQNITMIALTKKVFELEAKIEEMEKKS